MAKIKFNLLKFQEWKARYRAAKGNSAFTPHPNAFPKPQQEIEVTRHPARPGYPTVVIIEGYKGNPDGDKAQQRIDFYKSQGYGVVSAKFTSADAQSRYTGVDAEGKLPNYAPENAVFDSPEVRHGLYKEIITQTDGPVILEANSVGSIVAVGLANDPDVQNKISGTVLSASAIGLIEKIRAQIWDDTQGRFKADPKAASADGTKFNLGHVVVDAEFVKSAAVYEQIVVKAGVPQGMPCVMVHAAGDKVAPLALAKNFAEKNPAISLITLPEGSHDMGRPEDIAAVTGAIKYIISKAKWPSMQRTAESFCKPSHG